MIRPTKTRAQSGFSLVEMLFVLLMLAVLAGVAVAMQTKYVARARRTEAVMGLTDLARLQQTFFSMHDRYARNVRELAFALDHGRFLGDNVYEGPTYRYATSWRDETGQTFVGTAVGNLDGDGFKDVLLTFR